MKTNKIFLKGIHSEMTIISAVSRRIDELCRQHNITPNKLADLAGIPQSTISKIMNHKTDSPNTRIIFTISAFFGLTVCEFFGTDYFNEFTIQNDNFDYCF
jgi:transcriptional regulator with XRE-family HTH domain